MAAASVIPDDRLKGVCKSGQGEATCSFIGCGGEYICLKGTEMEGTIKRRRAERTMRALGDNCSGPPDFIPIAS